MKNKYPTRWEQGQTGNPSGRTMGAKTILRIPSDAGAIALKTLLRKALEGNVAAAAAVLGLAVPKAKPGPYSAGFEPTGVTPSDKAREVIQASSKGLITVSEVAEQIRLLNAAAQFEAKALEARLTTLEETRDSGNFR